MNTLPSLVTLMDWNKELLKTDDWTQVEETVSHLPSMASTPNEIVNLIHPTGGTLSVGIAGMGDSDNPQLSEPLACANHTPASSEPPYKSIVGDKELRSETGVVVFRYEKGTWTEIPRRNCVDLESLLQAVHHFCFSGDLDERFDWEEI